MEQPTFPFLDVPLLLDASEPRPRVNWFWYGVGLFALVVMGASYLASKSEEARVFVDAASLLLMLGIGGALALLTWRAVRTQRGEIQQVEAIEELVQLRRWDQAANMLQGLLSRPARMPGARVQALIYLASVLARYHRFNDAMVVQSYLIDNQLVDPGSAYGLRLGRTMAMLREDHLVDANQAISELRRIVGDQPSGGLALIEIYRDIRTGHASEAIALFEANLPALREQLGHRVADAYGLSACACDVLDKKDDAQRYYSAATCLAPVEELNRRYPELARLADRYLPTPLPQEAV